MNICMSSLLLNAVMMIFRFVKIKFKSILVRMRRMSFSTLKKDKELMLCRILSLRIRFKQKNKNKIFENKH